MTTNTYEVILTTNGDTVGKLDTKFQFDHIIEAANFICRVHEYYAEDPTNKKYTLQLNQVGPGVG